MAERDNALRAIVRHRASYGGAEFLMTSSKGQGGRKTAVKQLVGSDRQLIEDLGDNPIAWEVSGVIGAIDTRSYRQVRDTWLAAVKKKGPATFVHPFHGTITDVVCLAYTFDEKMTAVGEATISMSLGISDSDGRPTPTKLQPAAGQDQAAAAAKGGLADVESRYGTLLQNFTDAIDQQLDFLDTMLESTSVLSSVSGDASNSFSSAVTSYTERVASIVDTPATLAEEMGDLLNLVGQLYTSSSDALTDVGAFDQFTDTKATYERIFGFGDNDVLIVEDTHIRAERKANRDVMRLGVKAVALAGIYENAIQIDYATENDIEQTTEDLDALYFSIIDEVADSVRAELVTLRTVANAIFEEKIQDARRVLETHTHGLSTRLLAYRYYGSSDLGETLQRLNGLPDPYAVGDVKILTE